MAKLTLDLKEGPSVKDLVDVQKEVPVELPAFKQRSINNWTIRSGETTEIVAQSDLGDKFSGSIAEFNKRLRA